MPWHASALQEATGCCTDVIRANDVLISCPQILVPLGFTFAVLVLATAVAAATSLSGAAVIATMLPSVALMGVTTAVIQGGLFGLAGLCPPIYVQVRLVLHWAAYSLPGRAVHVWLC